MADFIIYADDTNLIFSDTDIFNLCRNINIELQKIKNWLDTNKLSLNIDKTEYMIFQTTKKYRSISDFKCDIRLNNKKLTRVEDTRFLGIQIDQNLNWSKNINKKAKQIQKTTCVMSKLKHQLPKHILKTIYFSLVESHLRFGILAWGNSPASQTHRLIVLQKKALRILTNSKKKSHTSHLFGNQEILKFEDLYKLNVIKFVTEYQYGECPSYFCDTLNTNV